jgi:hypothetical protein
MITSKAKRALKLYTAQITTAAIRLQVSHPEMIKPRCFGYLSPKYPVTTTATKATAVR